MEVKKLSLGQLNRPTLDELDLVKKLNYEVVADNVRSGQNIGSLFRTADAFGARGIVLSGISPTPPNKEVLKTALGATESVTWRYLASLSETINYLKNNNYRIIVIEQTSASVTLQDFKPSKDEKYALVFGNEVDGVDLEYIKNADLCVEIPQIGIKHSLNVSVCAGIIMWHFYQHLAI